MLSLHEIHVAIEEVSDQLETLVTEITAAGDDAAVCEASYKAEFAKARLRARADAADRKGRDKITVDEVTDAATVATEDLRRSHLLATNRLTVLREALRARQSRLDALRSLSAAYRAAGG